VHSQLAEKLRAEYQERIQRREERAVSAQNIETASKSPNAAAVTPTSANVEEIRRQAREAWLQLRTRQTEKSETKAFEQLQENTSPTGDRESVQHEQQDDLAL
jgi:predicted phage tail protein